MNLKISKNMSWVLAAGLVLLLVLSGAALAVGGYAIDWWTVDGGGMTSGEGDFVVSGSIGQPEAGSVMSNGDFSVAGGFWGGGAAVEPHFGINLPLVIR